MSIERVIKFRAWDDGMVYPTFPAEGGLTSADILARFETVMQFTGLLDKNGKEIYEGDVVEVQPANDQGHIVWIDGENGYQLTTSMGTYQMDDADGFEIIGNIYENSEFLSQEKSTNK